MNGVTQECRDNHYWALQFSYILQCCANSPYCFLFKTMAANQTFNKPVYKIKWPNLAKHEALTSSVFCCLGMQAF